MHHRLYPHRTPADVRALNSLTSENARILDAELQRQHRADLRHAEHAVPLEDIDAAFTPARWSHGTGGGRKRGPSGAPAD